MRVEQKKVKNVDGWGIFIGGEYIGQIWIGQSNGKNVWMNDETRKTFLKSDEAIVDLLKRKGLK